MSHETKLRRHLENRLSRLDKMENKQHDNDGTLEMTKRIRVSILIKENETFNKKKESKLYYTSKRTRIKILISNIYKTRETIIYKRLFR